MANNVYNIYCDESTHLRRDGHPYMVLGYVSISVPQIKLAKEQIKNIIKKYDYKGELKWTNVHEASYNMYKELIDYFFMTDMNFRAVIVNKKDIDESRPDYTFNDFYYRMYFQLLHNKTDLSNTYNVYLDEKDTCSSKKLKKLHEMLRWNASIEKIQFVKSYESLFVQLADVLMGAINYNLRLKENDVEGKVQAKMKLIETIRKHGDIEHTSPLSNNKFNLFFIKLK